MEQALDGRVERLNLAGALPIMASAAAVAESRMLLTNDTGLMHQPPGIFSLQGEKSPGGGEKTLVQALHPQRQETLPAGAFSLHERCTYRRSGGCG